MFFQNVQFYVVKCGDLDFYSDRELNYSSVLTQLVLLSATSNPLAGSPGWLLSAAGLPVATPGVSALIKGAPAGRLPREGALQPGFPPGTDGTQRGWRPGAGAGEENQRDAGMVLGPSGEKSPLATDSLSKWRQSYSPSREWLANVPIPFSLLACLHLLHLMYE